MADIRFGTDGWRSTVDTDFNERNVEIVAQAICDYILRAGVPGKGCVVAYDTRAHSRAFAEEVAGILSRSGLKAFLTVDFCPTPEAAFAVKHLSASGAIMLTASHNPPEYNGIKFIPHFSGPATPEITSEIEVEIAKVSEGRARSGDRAPIPVEVVDVSGPYVEQLLSLVDREAVERAGTSVVFDPMYGAGQVVFAEALDELGCRVIPQHVGVLPDFGGLLPEPTEANLALMKSAVVEHGADIGVALDGDADRFGVVDSLGVYLSPNKALTVILWYLLFTRKAEGGVARSLATTHMLDTIARSAGREVSETPVGFKYVGELMRKGSVLLGGEESGGMSIAGHIPEKDGLVAGLLLVEIASKLGKPLSAVLDDIYGEFGPCFDERIDIPLAEEAKRALMESLEQNPPGEIAGEPVVRTDLSDGVKLVTENDTWLLIRPSGTEPLVRAYVEARSATAFDKARKSAIIIVRGKSG